MAERRKTQRTLAIERVAARLASLSNDDAVPIVVDGHETGVYVQFAREGPAIVGEAVAARHLPKIVVHGMGDLAGRLRVLGWAEPLPGDDTHAGNWTRTWTVEGWDAVAVARITVTTMYDAYGVDYWAITATTAAASVPGSNRP